MSRIRLILPALLVLLGGCAGSISTGDTDATYLRAQFCDGSKVSVSDAGELSWQQGDCIAVHVGGGSLSTYTLKEVRDGIALFKAPDTFEGNPCDAAVYPAYCFKSFKSGTLAVSYPSSYSYGEGDMRAPMLAAVPSDNSLLSFRHTGAMLHISCEDVPEDAVSYRITASGRKIAGTFSIPSGADTVTAEESASGNTVRVNFAAGGGSKVFNVPIPAGTYPEISAAFYDASGELLQKKVLYKNITAERADMFCMAVEGLNGTEILAASTRIGLVTDASTGLGIPGIPVTDGYSFVMTDENGVYQMTANYECRTVSISLPSGYDIPVDAAGQILFWGTNSYRNDFKLSPRSSSWNDFSIVAVSDIHFTLKGENSTLEPAMFSTYVVPEINSYISGMDNVLAFNLGDMVSNYTGKLSQAKEAYAQLHDGKGKVLPMLTTIGNHDHHNLGSSTLECAEDYIAVFGPVDYSMNIGKAHIVCMDNIIYAGNATGGYGKSMLYDKGLTDAQWAWLQADLANVEDKQDKILLFCVHAPIFNNDYAHAADIRSLLKTFGESHIFSGHNHYNRYRQFTDSFKGLSGRISEEHNLPPTGGLWKYKLANDGCPAGFHVYSIEGGHMTARYFKALTGGADYQFDVYDGGACYSDPMDASTWSLAGDVDGYFVFDWKTLWQDSEGLNPEHCFIVRVFDAGTRGLGCNVYFVKDGLRTPMKRVSKTHRDQCAFSFFMGQSPSSSWAATYSSSGCYVQNFWYIEAPCGDPAAEQDWKVEVEIEDEAGVRIYESSTLRTDYSGYSF